MPKGAGKAPSLTMLADAVFSLGGALGDFPFLVPDFQAGCGVLLLVSELPSSIVQSLFALPSFEGGHQQLPIGSRLPC